MRRTIRITLPDGTTVHVDAYFADTQMLPEVAREAAMAKLVDHLKKIWPDGQPQPEIIPA